MNSTEILPKRPTYLDRSAQQATYLLKRQHFLIKAALITTVALAVIALITLPILNQYGVINAFSNAFQWSMLSIGVATSLITLIILYRFCKSKTYQANIDTAKRSNLELEMQFLLRKPKWSSGRIITGSGSSLREVTNYHDWYEFVEYKYGQAQKKGDHTLQVHYTNNKSQQVIYYLPPSKTGEPSDGIELFRANLPNSPRSRDWYPFFDDENNIYVASGSTIKRVSFTRNENNPNVRTHDIAYVAPQEVVSTIRYSDGVVIVGYQSGLVQLSAVSEDNVQSEIARVRSDGEISDAWIDKAGQKLIIVSDMSHNLVGSKRRRIKVWKF